MLTNLCRMYYTEYNLPPGRSHVEIIAALGGQNPRQVIFSKFNDLTLDRYGRVVDPWASPYQFDTHAPSDPIVWSIGPNRKNDLRGADSDDDILTDWK